MIQRQEGVQIPESNGVAESVLPELSSMGKEEGKNPTGKSSCVRDVVTKYTTRETGTKTL